MGSKHAANQVGNRMMSYAGESAIVPCIATVGIGLKAMLERRNLLVLLERKGPKRLIRRTEVHARYMVASYAPTGLLRADSTASHKSGETGNAYWFDIRKGRAERAIRRFRPAPVENKKSP